MPVDLTPEQRASNFCTVPSSTLMISPNGDYRVCSLINDHSVEQGLCRDASGSAMNVITHSFEEAMNSHCHLKLRATQATNGQHSMCSCCYDRDKLPGAGSMRTYKTFELSQFIPEFHSKFAGERIEGGPLGLDLRFGNLCNQKCIVCGPWYSNQWHEDYAAYHKREFYTFGGKNISIKPDTPRVGSIDGVAWWESDIWWQRFHAIKPRLRHLYFTGGEPLIVPAHDRVLQELVDGGYAKDIAIELDTNLSALNPRIIKHWSHFRHVDLRVSVDVTHEQYTVARFPGSFPKLEANMRAVLADLPPNLRMMISSCVTPLSVFYMKRMDDWIQEVFNVPDASDVKINNMVHRRFVEEPFQMSIKFSSAQVKDRIHSWLVRNPSAYSPMVQNYILNNYDSYNEKSENMVRYMDFLDQRRGTNWRQAFSVAVEALGL